MSVKTINGEYPVTMMDSVDRFHGNQLVYVGWDHHTMLCSANAFPLPPAMPFGALVSEVLPSVLAAHPDFAQIDWDQVEWNLDGKHFIPDLSKSLEDNGVIHKSLIRMRTPGLDGYRASGN